MPTTLKLSPLRAKLCSYDNAFRVAIHWAENDTPAAIIMTGDPLQPWRVIERAATFTREVRACA